MKPEHVFECDGCEEADGRDAVYFFSCDNKPVELVPAKTAVRFWNQSISLKQMLLPAKKTVGIITITRKDLQPTGLFAITLALTPERFAKALSIEAACKDAKESSNRPVDERPKEWTRQFKGIPHASHADTDRLMAIALDTTIFEIRELPIRIGGPLTMARLAKISVDEAISFIVDG